MARETEGRRPRTSLQSPLLRTVERSKSPPRQFHSKVNFQRGSQNDSRFGCPHFSEETSTRARGSRRARHGDRDGDRRAGRRVGGSSRAHDIEDARGPQVLGAGARARRGGHVHLALRASDRGRRGFGRLRDRAPPDAVRRSRDRVGRRRGPRRDRGRRRREHHPPPPGRRRAPSPRGRRGAHVRTQQGGRRRVHHPNLGPRARRVPPRGRHHLLARRRSVHPVRSTTRRRARVRRRRARGGREIRGTGGVRCRVPSTRADARRSNRPSAPRHARESHPRRRRTRGDGVRRRRARPFPRRPRRLFGRRRFRRFERRRAANRVGNLGTVRVQGDARRGARDASRGYVRARRVRAPTREDRGGGRREASANRRERSAGFRIRVSTNRRDVVSRVSRRFRGYVSRPGASREPSRAGSRTLRGARERTRTRGVRRRGGVGGERGCEIDHGMPRVQARVRRRVPRRGARRRRRSPPRRHPSRRHERGRHDRGRHERGRHERGRHERGRRERGRRRRGRPSGRHSEFVREGPETRAERRRRRRSSQSSTRARGRRRGWPRDDAFMGRRRRRRV